MLFFLQFRWNKLIFDIKDCWNKEILLKKCPHCNLSLEEKVQVRKLFKGGKYCFMVIFDTLTYSGIISINFNWCFYNSKTLKSQQKLCFSSEKPSYLVVMLRFGIFGKNFFGFKLCNLLKEKNAWGRKVFNWGNYSREETIQGRKLLIIRRFWLRKLFKGGNYSREETIWGNTVFKF